MFSCTCLLPVSTFLIGGFEPKFMTAARKFPLLQKKSRKVGVHCSSTKSDSHVESTLIRQSDVYEECVRGYDHFPDPTLDDLSDEVQKLKEKVRYMMQNSSCPIEQLELIDDLQRLGVAYHFDTEIQSTLEIIHKGGDYNWVETDLHTAALMFRILRQNGLFVTQDIFNTFIDSDTKEFKLSLCEDIKGLLSLYEASHLSIEGETIMEQGLNFTTTYLYNHQISEKLAEDTYLYTLVTHALELPLHWRSQRLEARWFIDAYPRKPNMRPCFLEFAKLDFNMLQKMHQDELQDLSRWWENLGLVKAMDFVRDGLVMSHIWSASIHWEPEYKIVRKIVTQVTALATLVDDVYDANVPLDDLELFTRAFERWDIEATEKLPHHMRMCYVAINDFINEVACLSLCKNGFSSLTALQFAWTTISRSFLNESRWHQSGYHPTLEEYMNNARISVGSYLSILYGYIFYPTPVSDAEIKNLESDPDILKSVALIFRACNDLATCQKELKLGTNTPKLVQCYMHETQASQEAAVKHVRDMVTIGWKNLNKTRYKEKSVTMSSVIVDKLVDAARAGVCVYQYHNPNGMDNSEFKRLISTLLYEPTSI